MKVQKYIDYANHLEAKEPVIAWINTTLNNYLGKKEATTTEVEHVIDYLIRNDIPKINQMSYPQAVLKAERWNKSLQKKAEKVSESPEDTKVVLDFKDGFKIVQLIGKNAYDREGYLMRHCVASYFGRDVKVYSLRDALNNPHATMEQDQQIKGKGNGDIHPKYIDYVVKFLEYTGMEVRDSEMLHLGYINLEKFTDHIDTKNLFKKKYHPKSQAIVDKEGKEFACLDLLNQVPLIDENTLKVNFNLKTFIPLSFEFLWKHIKKTDKVDSGHSSKLASSGDYSQLASSGHSSQLASSGDSSQLASSGDSSKLASSGDSSQLASSGHSSQLASSGDYSQLASSGDYSQLASSGDYSKLEVKGDKSVGANIGYDGIIKGILGSWITLAEYDKNGNPVYVKSAKIDGKKLKPNVWYQLKNKRFKEVKV